MPRAVQCRPSEGRTSDVPKWVAGGDRESPGGVILEAEVARCNAYERVVSELPVTMDEAIRQSDTTVMRRTAHLSSRTLGPCRALQEHSQIHQLRLRTMLIPIDQNLEA